MNLILYLIFIAIVLAYQYSQPEIALQCGGRVSSSYDELAKVQKNVSIAYATIIGAISLFLAIGYAYFGTKLQKEIQGGKGVAKSKQRNQRVNEF